MKTVSIIGDVFKNLLNSDIFNSDPTTKINNLTNGITAITDYLSRKEFKHLRKSAKQLRKILKHFGNGVKVLIDSGMLKNNDETFKVPIETTLHGITAITTYLDNRDKFKNIRKSSKDLKNTLINMADGLEVLKPTLSVSAEGMKDLAKAFKELDMELIANEENRSKAMQTMSSNFRDMADSIKDLNNAMAK